MTLQYQSVFKTVTFTVQVQAWNHMIFSSVVVSKYLNIEIYVLF